MKQSTRSTRKEARLKKQRIRSTIFIAIVVGVLGLAGYYIKSAFFRPPPAPLAGNVIDVSASMGGFDKTEIRVKVGQPVIIRLTSMDNSAHTDGGGKHQWAIDELALDMVAQPEGSNSVTFTPTKPGSYNYYCNICCGGRANPSMNGTLIVEG
ncbi:MAG: cupredoxin domain-containing protein [Chloroflexi bacterium]|nr:cupredoxin domain-containing protein [Chloroflexota bacterium]